MFTQTKTEYFQPLPLTFKQEVILSLCHNVGIFNNGSTYEGMAKSIVYLANCIVKEEAKHD